MFGTQGWQFQANLCPISLHPCPWTDVYIYVVYIGCPCPG
nr:MAG TPA: hypothetical protein [Caudoviricetes sp.]